MVRSSRYQEIEESRRLVVTIGLRFGEGLLVVFAALFVAVVVQRHAWQPAVGALAFLVAAVLVELLLRCWKREGFSSFIAPGTVRYAGGAAVALLAGGLVMALF